MANPAKPAEAEETSVESLEAEYENTPLEDDSLEVPGKKPVATAASAKAGATEEPAEKPKLSPRLLRMCRDLDISDDEIDGLPAESVEVIVSREIRRQRDESKRAAKSEAEIERRKVERQEEEDEITWGMVEDSETGKMRPATDDEIHPAILPILKAQQKEIKALKAQIAGTQQTTAASRQEQFEKQFDASCSRFKKTLGEGTYTELKGTPFTKKREVVFKEVLAIIQSDRNVSMDDAVERAVREVYGVKLNKPAKPAEQDGEEDESAKVRSNYSSGKTVRPSGRKGKQPRGQKAAEDAVEAWMSDNLPDAQDEGDDESEY